MRQIIVIYPTLYRRTLNIESDLSVCRSDVVASHTFVQPSIGQRYHRYLQRPGPAYGPSRSTSGLQLYAVL